MVHRRVITDHATCIVRTPGGSFQCINPIHGVDVLDMNDHSRPCRLRLMPGYPFSMGL